MTTPNPNVPDSTLDSLLLDTTPYLSCDDCFEQIDAYVEKLVADPTHEDLPMQLHVQACSACAEEAETLAELLREE